MTDAELRACIEFRLRTAEQAARDRHPPEDFTPATIASFQVQLEDDAARGDPAAVELREQLLTAAITRLVENPRWL